MRFRDLNNAEGFTFEVDDRFLCTERGPWMKLSARTYSLWPTDDNVNHPLSGEIIRVGSINAKVIPTVGKTQS